MQRRGAGRKIPYGMISVIADTWMHELPAFGRLHCAVERVSGGMHITETRVATMLFQPPEWQGASEYAVYLLSIEIGVLRGRMNINAKRLAVVGLHALARRYERGSGQTDDALLFDIGALAQHPLPDGEFAFPIPTGGRWVGAAQNREASVRTFIGDA